MRSRYTFVPLYCAGTLFGQTAGRRMGSLSADPVLWGIDELRAMPHRRDDPAEGGAGYSGTVRPESGKSCNLDSVCSALSLKATAAGGLSALM